ncbi:SixA phosphatase family protein [Candidatus Poriferisocius sp.]|uniref:SixA phosphatase family protein n=1 Tax=Candidatus Poriferisocius sp. TaxID=3101276 RepID=UPI003B59336E
MASAMFLRHAKSDWDVPVTGDFERPLNDRGLRAAAAVGKFLTEINHVPDFILCSPAIRARQTVEVAIHAGKWPCPLEMVDELYDGTVHDMVGLATRRQVPVVMVVGHEPTLSTAVGQLTGAEVRMPTAALARVKLQVDKTGELEWLIPPRLLTDR